MSYHMTAAKLRHHAACSGHVEAFASKWPDGVEVTVESLVEAAEAGLNIHWLYELLTMDHCGACARGSMLRMAMGEASTKSPHEMKAALSLSAQAAGDEAYTADVVMAAMSAQMQLHAYCAWRCAQLELRSANDPRVTLLCQFTDIAASLEAMSCDE